MRAFVAISMPEEVRDALEELQSHLPVGRLMTRDTLHLTLAFLGEQPETVLEEVHNALDELRAPGFALRLTGLGTFGAKSPTVLWAGVASAPALTDLRRKVRSAVRRAEINLRHERFRPHVTIARFRNSLHVDEQTQIGWFLERHGNFKADAFSVERFTLFRSRLGAEGAEHEALAEYALN